MLTLFRTNQALVNLIVLIFLVLFRLPAMFIGYDLPINQGAYLAQIFGGILFGQHWLAFTLNTIAIFIQVVILNEINIRHRITKRLDLFPGYFMTILVCSIPILTQNTPVHFANLFLLIAVYALLRTFRANQCADRIFNVGFLIGLASLFYFSYMIFLLLSVFGLNLMRALKGKEILMVLFGFLVPYILLMTYNFWNDDLYLFFEQQFSQSIGVFNWRFPSNLSLIIQTIWMTLLLIYSILASGWLLSRRVMQVQLKIRVFYWCLLLAGLSLLLQGNITMDHWGILIIPLGLVVGLSVSLLKPTWAEFVNMSLIVCMIGLHLSAYFLSNI